MEVILLERVAKLGQMGDTVRVRDGYAAIVRRLVRIAILGLVLIALALTGTIGAWGWIGVIPLVTAALGWCPAYTLLGIKTCPTQQ